MGTANRVVRRIVAWPLILIGAGLTQLGCGFIRIGAWAIDLDVSEFE